MPRLPISAETAVKLAAFMNVPVEHLMHMPQHIMLQKLAEMAMAEGAKSEAKPSGGVKDAGEAEGTKDGKG